MDVVAVERAARMAAAAVRAGEGPRFLENRTYRFRAHSMFDPELYRDKTEVSEWKKRCPIDRFRNWAVASGILHEADVSEIESAVAAEVEAAVAFAEEAPWEPVEALLRDVVTPRESVAT
jgi:TPP-dependent pyruvate/acetoin dehydrogenase alpha subunit